MENMINANQYLGCQIAEREVDEPGGDIRRDRYWPHLHQKGIPRT